MTLRDGELLIGDHNYRQHIEVEVDGEVKGRGLKKRNWGKHPAGSYLSAHMTALDIPLIPKAEYSERIAEKVAKKSQLSDIRAEGNNGQMIPSRDQNGKGYCWAHSSTSALLLLRAVANEPYADLSAYAVACVIKNFRDEGGWGAQSLDFIMTRGIPTSKTWPQQSMAKANDTTATWEEAKKYRVTAGWVDMASAQYDRNLTFDQVITCVLSNIPVVVDFNWWSHSVCGADAVDGVKERDRCRVESGKLADLKTFEKMWGMNDPVTAGIGLRIWNSWGNSWSQQGMGVLSGSKAVPDGSVAPRVPTMAA